MQEIKRFPTVLIDPEEILNTSVRVLLGRRRGRPHGSKTRISHSKVTADEFALLRAVAQGLDLTVAARQYLLWPGRMPERDALEKLYAELLQRVASGAESLQDAATARAMVRDLLRLQALELETREVHSPEEVVTAPAQNTQAPASAIPTLEEFARQFPDDMYRESELVEMYEEEYPQGVHSNAPQELVHVQLAPAMGIEIDGAVLQTNTSAGSRPLVMPSDSLSQRVPVLLTAIEWLGSRLAVQPARENVLEQWIRVNPAQREAFNAAGVINLGNLADWIALRGPRWHRLVPRYGATRAEAVQCWLQKSGITPAQGLPSLALPTALRQQASIDSKLAPLTAMAWPVSLRGEDGMFRSKAPNTLKAHDDVEAVQRWFALLQDNSQATQLAYRRAIERLVLWAVHIKSIALSSLATPDLLEFRDFLRHPPKSWVQDKDSSRAKGAAGWRPLRGPLTDKSLSLTFAAISAMFNEWLNKGYIISNPALGISTTRRDQVTLDVMRSFSAQDLLVIRDTFDSLPNGSTKVRLAAVLRLLESSGLRREEAQKAKWSDLSKARLQGAVSESWVLDVIGKGQRQRLVPINDNTMAALLAHREDRQDLIKSGHLSMFSHILPQNMPLIGVIDERWHQTLARQRAALAKEQASDGLIMWDGQASDDEAEKQSENGALSGSGLYVILKSFFKQCAARAGADNSDFNKASTHWLRHTFAHHALDATNKDLSVVQQLLGHASITTTSIYTKADLQSRVLAVAKIKTAI